MIVTSAMGDDLLKKRARQFAMKKDFSKDIIANFHERAIKSDDPVSFVERAKMLSANDLALVYKAMKEDGFKKVGRDIHERSSRVFSAMKIQADKIDKDGTIDGLDPTKIENEGSDIVGGVSVKIVPDVFVHHSDQEGPIGQIDIVDGAVLSGDKGKVMDAIIEPGSFTDDDKPVKELKGKNACIVYKGRAIKCVPSLEGTGKKAPRYGWDFDFTKFENYRAWRSFLDDNSFTSLGSSTRKMEEKFGSGNETQGEYYQKTFGDKGYWQFSHPSGIRVMTEHPGRKNKLRPDFDGFVGWIYVGIPAGKLDTWKEIREDMLKRADPKGEDAFSGIYDPWIEGGKR